eukprot:scaffold183584_cov28-Tisochrysis_lutea.AAC.3
MQDTIEATRLSANLLASSSWPSPSLEAAAVGAGHTRLLDSACCVPSCSLSESATVGGTPAMPLKVAASLSRSRRRFRATAERAALARILSLRIAARSSAFARAAAAASSLLHISRARSRSALRDQSREASMSASPRAEMGCADRLVIFDSTCEESRE